MPEPIPKPKLDAWYACIGKTGLDTIKAADLTKIDACARQVGLSFPVKPADYVGQSFASLVTETLQATGQYADLGLGGAFEAIARLGQYAIALALVIAGLWLYGKGQPEKVVIQ